MASYGLASHEGEETIQMRTSTGQPVKLYGSWRCPFSQRIWAGLEEKAVDYEWIETGFVEAPDERTCEPNSAQLPRGSRKRRTPALDNNGEWIHDPSGLVVLEYVHEIFGGPPLLPAAPQRRALVRYWTRHVDYNVVPHFDCLLSAQDAEDRSHARAALSEGLAELEESMAPEADGPFFLGDDFSMVDIALAPYWQRMCSVLRAYRKFDPSACPRLQVWYEAVQARPSFKRTIVDTERLIEAYSDVAARIEETSEGGLLRAPVRGGAAFRRAKVSAVTSASAV
mmetsp:Transcript_87680/g.246318  ORF Transcript_87680/g.246318 Transcript_87680/m.246318 type:complete len:283 (-) Transcript_87680:74-922(-)